MRNGLLKSDLPEYSVADNIESTKSIDYEHLTVNTP